MIAALKWRICVYKEKTFVRRVRVLDAETNDERSRFQLEVAPTPQPQDDLR